MSKFIQSAASNQTLSFTGCHFEIYFPGHEIAAHLKWAEFNLVSFIKGLNLKNPAATRVSLKSVSANRDKPETPQAKTSTAFIVLHETMFH